MTYNFSMKKILTHKQIGSILPSMRHVAAETNNRNHKQMSSNKLGQKAVLVKFSAGCVGNSRKDIRITADTQARMGMGAKSGRWIKQLFPDEALAPIQGAKNEFYTWLNERCLPWPDDGFALLPSALAMAVAEREREAKAKWQAAVDSFFDRWQEWVDWGRKEHNGTFDPANYRQDKARRAMRWACEFRPIPESSHYSSEMAGLLGQSTGDVDTLVATTTKEAMADLWRRLAAPIQHLVQHIAAAESKERTRYCESLLENIRIISTLVPALNIEQDPALAVFAREIEFAIQGLSVEALRDDKTTRQNTLDKANEILARMAGYITPAE